MSAKNFLRLGYATLIAVYCLISAGGIVRATGSGMGCPDWPKCFGQWIPPTAESQLPADYQVRYADHGYRDAPFNVVKTWTEYVNRLLGVVIGFLIFLTLLGSLRYWRSHRAVVWWCLASFIVVGFQGWLGSVVVATNLRPWLVTAHMLVALLLVGMLLYALRLARLEEYPPSRIAAGARRLLVAGLAVSFLQIGLGTQVREQVDVFVERALERASWIESLGPSFTVHRLLSVLVLALGVLLFRALRNHGDRLVRRGVYAIVAVILLEILAGTIMYLAAIPPWLQPTHLVLASVLAGLQFLLLTGSEASAG